MQTRVAVAGALLVAVLPVSAASAHPERPSVYPDWKKGSVPEYRTRGPALVVCKSDSRARIRESWKGRGPKRTRERRRQLRLLRKCRFEHIQQAVDAARSGHRILVLPGVYREEPSLQHPYPEERCKDMFEPEEGPEVATGGEVIRRLTAEDGATAPQELASSYEYHYNCPQSANAIAINGDDPHDGDRVCDQKCNLQIEGTGRQRRDVQILGDGSKLNLIKADRADGIYLRNFYIERSDFNNIYALETNGFVFEDIESGPSREYGFLSFASDNGLYTHLEAHHAGDSGIYPGSGPEGHCARFGIVVRHSESHHNNMGFSGTAGNGTYYHDNEFHHNALGGAVDSFATGHPGQPQDCSKWERNRIYSNNMNIFTEERQDYCRETPVRERDPYKVCSTFQVPVGVGMLIAGGNGNVVRDNWFWDNWRHAFMLHTVPATLRGEDDPDKAADTSHGNRIVGNHIGIRPDGSRDPNGSFTWWDEQGTGNCWDENEGDLTSDPMVLPRCPIGSMGGGPNPHKGAQLVPCAAWDPKDDDLDHPPGCDWFEPRPEPK